MKSFQTMEDNASSSFPVTSSERDNNQIMNN